MTPRDKAITYVYKSEVINKAIKRIVPQELIKEFESFLMLQICEMKHDKLIRAYDEGYIDFLCIRIIENHIKTNNSLFKRLYRTDTLTSSDTLNDKISDDLFGIVPISNYKHSKKISLLEATDNKESPYEDLFEGELLDEIAEEKSPYFELFENDEIQTTILKRIEEIVRHLPLYENILWNLQWKEGHSLRKIAELTTINYNSVYYNINKTKNLIKTTILNENPSLKNSIDKIFI